jgi:hypothetical protein
MPWLMRPTGSCLWDKEKLANMDCSVLEPCFLLTQSLQANAAIHYYFNPENLRMVNRSSIASIRTTCFSELSVAYSHAFSKKADVFAYVGYPGEPALGPVAFMHRASALFNPDAPISHHWIDATHITFGVATLGVRVGNFKLEGSSFTGREPDENRYDLDRPRFDSWSGRLSFNPSKNWALQVSHAYIKSPESLHPDENIHRTTASAEYSPPFATRPRVECHSSLGDE